MAKESDKAPKTVPEKKVDSSSATAKNVPKLGDDAFSNKQLSLFQTFFINADKQNQASNSIEFWDSMPRYSVSQTAMNKMRDEKGRLDLLEIEFLYKKSKLKITIQPALIQDEVKGVKTTSSYYPSANEELVEEALRKIAAIQNMGFHEQSKRSGVVFTLYQLREELRGSGHARSYDEIVKSLNILSSSMIEISSGDTKNKSFARSPYFPVMAGVTRENLTAEPNARWYVQFHPLVTESLDKLTYRQFNYQQLMSHSTQLARWLHKLIVNKYTFANKMNPFEMRYSTIKRDSAMLSNYSRERKAIEACDFAMNELIKQQIASTIKREPVTGNRGKIEDVVYTITPTIEFVREVKASNARQNRLKVAD